MTRSNNGKIYAGIAAILYVIYAVGQFLWLYAPCSDYFYYYEGESVLRVIYGVLAVAIAATLLIGNQKATIGVVGVFCLTSIASVINFNINYGIEYDSYCNPYPDLIEIGVYATLFVIGILMLSGNSIVKKIWFIPGIAALVAYGIYWNQQLFSCIPLSVQTILDFWQLVIPHFCGHASVIFVGLWLMKNVVPVVYQSPAYVDAFGGVNTQKREGMNNDDHSDFFALIDVLVDWKKNYRGLELSQIAVSKDYLRSNQIVKQLVVIGYIADSERDIRELIPIAKKFPNGKDGIYYRKLSQWFELGNPFNMSGEINAFYQSCGVFTSDSEMERTMRILQAKCKEKYPQIYIKFMF